MILTYFIILPSLHIVCVTGSKSAIKFESDIYIPVILGYNYISDSSGITGGVRRVQMHPPLLAVESCELER